MTPRMYGFILTLFAIVCVTLPIPLSSHLGFSMETTLAYLHMLTFIGYGLPLVSSLVLYAIALKAIRSNQFTASCAGQIQAKRDRTTFRLFMTVVIAFFISVFPHLVIDVYYHFHSGKPSAFLVHESALLFHVLNPCINPFIYSKMHQDVRQFSSRFWNRAFNARAGPGGNVFFLVESMERPTCKSSRQQDASTSPQSARV